MSIKLSSIMSKYATNISDTRLKQVILVAIITIVLGSSSIFTSGLLAAPTNDTPHSRVIKPPTGVGSTDPEAGSTAYPRGSTAKVTATPEPGWSLDGWVLDGAPAGGGNPFSGGVDK